MNELTVNIDLTSNIPMYEQIYEYIKDEIKAGRLECGCRLPSTRALALCNGVSRSTTQMAYDQLVSEGYIEASACRGYFVCQLDGICDIEMNTGLAFASARPADSDTISMKSPYDYDFSPRGIALDSFPFNAWRKVSKNVLTNDNKELFNNGEPEGEPALRATICDYLHRFRGVICSPEQVILGAGNEYLLMLLHRLIDENAVFAMENPTYNQAYLTLKSCCRTIIPIEMDKDGIDVDALEKSSADVAYVMPSHQFPTGIVMPLKRRRELLSWASKNPSRYIIEDDYDSEFRYRGKPIPSLQGSAGPSDRVIYLGTFSKAIAPAIRMSYVVLPVQLLEVYRSSCRFLSNTVSRIDQTIVNDFINGGYYERHLNKLRSLYKSRHDALLAQLKPFEREFDIHGEYSGIHLLLTAKKGLRCDVTEDELVNAAAAGRVRVYPMSAYCIGNARTTRAASILIGYANISEDDIVAGVERLKGAWGITEAYADIP